MFARPLSLQRMLALCKFAQIPRSVLQNAVTHWELGFIMQRSEGRL